MVLRIYPTPQPYAEVYEELLNSIPAGNQWHTGPVVLPLPHVDSSPFLIEGTIGEVVEVFNNNFLITTIVLTEPRTPINIKLVGGKNQIYVRSSSESYFILVVAVNYATWIRGYAQEYFFNVGTRFSDAQAQLNSELSLRMVEHQIDFQQYLPPTRAMRVLAGKLAVRSLINEVGSTRGVDDIVSAIANTTPVVVPTQVELDVFEPGVKPLYSAAHDEGGFAFHVWFPNICAGSWAAFVKLMDNLDPSIAELQSVSDELVRLRFLGQDESHIFDYDRSDCSSMVSILTRDCLPIVVSAALLVRSELAFCAWGYPFDHVVDTYLGRYRFDSLLPFSQTVLAGSLLTDVTGSITGTVGAVYTELDNPPSRIVLSTIISPLGSFLVRGTIVPGTRIVWFTPGSGGRPISIRYEGSLAFDSGVDLDSAEEADPLSDGWRGLPLVSRFDGGSCLDTYVPDTSLFEDLDCCFSSPETTLAVASFWELELEMSSSVWVNHVVVANPTPAGVINGADDVFDGVEQVFN